MWDDLLINGTALSDLGVINDFSGIAADAPLRGENLTYPNVGGDVHVPKVRSAYVFSVPFTLLGDTRAAYNDLVTDLRALLDSSTAPLALERRLTTGAGEIAETADGDYLSGLEPTLINWQTGRLALDIINLSAGWTPVP